MQRCVYFVTLVLLLYRKSFRSFERISSEHRNMNEDRDDEEIDCGVVASNGTIWYGKVYAVVSCRLIERERERLHN